MQADPARVRMRDARRRHQPQPADVVGTGVRAHTSVPPVATMRGRTGRIAGQWSASGRPWRAEPEPGHPRAAVPSASRAMMTCWIWLVPS
ncbi:hypothetical protein ACFPM0_14490 [Pseudonocardia sulfidoxydans]|uniref:hypothetical protein n=1 Tax=Pseudonocardia sulfidoxydans TaxID=54011 RepID=UPI003623E1BF